MTELHQVSSPFDVRGHAVHALLPAGLTVPDGKVSGLLGFSGAGKSTLLRLINQLEARSSGRVRVGDTDRVSLSQSDLRQALQQIGMNFQQFNLLSCRTGGHPQRANLHRARTYRPAAAGPDHAVPVRCSCGNLLVGADMLFPSALALENSAAKFQSILATRDDVAKRSLIEKRLTGYKSCEYRRLVETAP